MIRLGINDNLIPSMGIGLSSKRRSSAGGGFTPGLPAGFNFPSIDWPWTVTIAGRTVTTDLDPEFYKPATTATYYVNSITGNDSNDGLTPGTAVLGIDTAITKANTNGQPATIYIAAGRYHRQLSFNNTVPSVDMAFIATGGRVISSVHDNLTYASVGSDTYSATRSNVCAVLDMLNFDGRGDPLMLTQVADLAACQALAGSWAQVGTTLYVHRADGAAVTNGNTIAPLMAGNFEPSAGSIYVENVDFWGGGGAGCVVVRGGSACFNNCTFAYCGNANIPASLSSAGLHNRGGLLCVAVDCRAHHNISDGFDLKDPGAIGTKMITVRCEAHDNGYSGGTSCNGLTQHDGAKAIDISGLYHNNYGPNVAAINAGTQLWAVGTVCRDSLGDVDSGPEDFWVDGCEYWLDTCTSESAAALVALNTGEINIVGFSGGGTQTGTVNPYSR